jgi:hypothetical protein
MSEEYAYGDWKADGEKCPLASAKMENAYYSSELAEEFDDVARDLMGECGKGTMSEEEAAHAWSRLINYLRRRAQQKGTRSHQGYSEYSQNLLSLAEDVQSVEFDG